MRSFGVVEKRRRLLMGLDSFLKGMCEWVGMVMGYEGMRDEGWAMRLMSV